MMASRRQGRSSRSETDRRRTCFWCHEQLPPLADDASYVETINHVIHEECRAERDEMNQRRETLLASIAEGRIDSIPDSIRQPVLDRIRRTGFSRRCSCLSWDAVGPAAAAARGGEVNADVCVLCGDSGRYDPLPKLLELTDDNAAAAWVSEELPRGAGPCDHWTDFPESGWYYDALGYNRVGKGPVRGVTLYNPEAMLGGVITWFEIADLFRPRVQSTLF